MKNYSKKKIKAQKKKKEKTNMDVDQCVDVRWVLNRHVSEIGSLGLQKFIIVVIVGFF
jgi:hypothetical protein